MSEGGGFCEKHGPFDPPHTVCPFCARADPQRRAFGPPVKPSYRPRKAPPQPETPDDAEALPDAEDPPDGFKRETVEPEPPQLTEVAPVSQASEHQTAVDLDAVPDDDHQPMGWLVVKEPADKRGEVLHIRHGQVIGREGDIRWADPRLSRQHARFTVEPLGETVGDQLSETLVFHIWPFAPTNPVLINGTAVRGATPLHENDEVRLGDTLFVFKMLTD